MSISVVVFPGTFDPLTMGHILVIKRALRVFDKVVVAIAINTPKKSMFSVNERVHITKDALDSLKDRVEVDCFDGLLSLYVKKKGLSLVIRGVRDTTDFNYEFKMSTINSELNNDMETLFIPTTPDYQYISSSFVKEIALMGGDISRFVPPGVDIKIKRAINAER